MISEKLIHAEKVKNIKGKAKYILNNNEFFVEELAQKIYEEENFSSFWSENNYWWTLFSLLFWDIIFAKLDGVWSPKFWEFPSQYQDMPQDFFSDNFYEKRKNLFNNRIKELFHLNIKQQLQLSYQKNYNKPCRPIENRDKFTIEKLSIAIEKIETNKLLKILERLAKDFNNNRSGFPDLFVYSENEYFFVEVKGETDKISEKQNLWHSFLSKELGIKVEICMVNKIEKTIKITEKEKSKQIKFSFWKSTSSKRENAIEFIKKQPTFKYIKENNEDIYSAIFDISNIENLYAMLDLTSGWKSQKIEIDGKIWKSTWLRESLNCFRRKEKERKSMDYCLTNEWDEKKNKFQCRNFFFNELENNSWNNYGYIDTQKGEWIFDKNAIEEEVKIKIENLSLCPLLNTKHIIKLLKDIPDSIDPKKNKKWGFIDNDRNVRFWEKNKWQSQWKNYPFPGISMMVGIKKLEASDFKYSSNIYDYIEESIKTNNDKIIFQKIWFKTWWGILLTIAFYPILVPYLVWTKTKWNIFVRIGITIFIIIIFISMV